MKNFHHHYLPGKHGFKPQRDTCTHPLECLTFIKREKSKTCQGGRITEISILGWQECKLLYAIWKVYPKAKHTHMAFAPTIPHLVTDLREMSAYCQKGYLLEYS